MGLVIGLTVVFFVPVLVWAMVIAGLRQIVRDKIRETHLTQTEPTQEVQQPMAGDQRSGTRDQVDPAPGRLSLFT